MTRSSRRRPQHSKRAGTIHELAPSSPLIRLSHCSVILSDTVVLDEVDFTLHAGERWLLVGANGAGKTLLLKLLAGDVWPTSTGVESREYRFDGDVETEPYDSRRCIAYVGAERQDKYVRYDWNFAVVQIVTTGLFDEDIPRTCASAAQVQMVTRLLKRFKLWSLRQRKFLTLSYGQRRRALVARAFASRPKVLLLDEVFNGLDIASARILRQVLESRSEAAKTWIISTHRPHDVPSNVTHMAKMANGRLAELSRRSDKFTAPAQHRTRSVGYQRIERLPSDSNRSVAKKTENKSAPLLRLRDVNLYREYRLVLRDVNWNIARGEHWLIIGRNGSGKSMLLKLLYGDLHPQLGGSIEREGMLPGRPIAEWKRRVGYVSPEMQAEYFLARDLEEIVISGRYASIGLNNPATPADRRAASRWLKFFSLEKFKARKPRAVSYGQLRLALLARAMINNPKALLLDEPFTGLDSEVRSRMIRLLDQLARRGVQLILALHDHSELPHSVTRMLEIRPDKRIEVTPAIRLHIR